MKRIIAAGLCFCLVALGDTPPPGTVKLKGGTDNTTIGNVSDSLKVDVTNAITATVSGTVPVSQSGIWSVGRTWALSSGTDSCSSVQSGAWTTGRTWDLNFATDQVDASGSSISVSNFPATQPVSGTVVANQGTSPWVTSVSNFPATQAVTQSGIWNVGLSAGANTIGKVDQGAGGASAWKVDGSAVTQPISAASLPLPSGASTSANQTTANSSLSSIDSKLTSPITVSGPLTDTQLRASAVPISAASLPLPSGASTSANQTTANSSLSSIDGKLNSLGQKTSVNSVPVVIASDQSTVPVSVASLPLPAGAATSANQTNGTQKSQQVDGSGNVQPSGDTVARKIFVQPTDGTNSASYTAAGAAKTDGSATTQPISAASLPLPTGAATSANQTTANSSLSSIDGKLNSLGQKPMTTSVPVTLASDQSSLPRFQDVTSTGSIAAVNNEINLVPNGASTATIRVSGTWVGTLMLEGTNDGTNYNTVTGSVVPGGALTTSITANGDWRSNVTAYSSFRVRASAWTSGSATVTILASAGVGILRVFQTNPDSFTTRASAGGLVKSLIVRNDYSSTNVTTAAYVQLTASTATDINRLMIFDSSGQDFVLATGAAASEVDQIEIPPGGWDAPVDLFIAAGTRISIKSKSATANSGILLITGLK